MRFDDFQAQFSSRPWFDLATVAQLTVGRRQTLKTQLSRWTKAGKLIRLRQGVYSFAEPYRRVRIAREHLANQLYRPSYLSTHWALGFYDLIPESVFMYTSVTTRVPRTFSNALGTFRYFNVKRDLFFGFGPRRFDGEDVQVAEPEKALIDLWHLSKGEWTLARMAGMRFQNCEQVEGDRLQLYAKRCRSSRLERAAVRWESFVETVNEGMVDL